MAADRPTARVYGTSRGRGLATVRQEHGQEWDRVFGGAFLMLGLLLLLSDLPVVLIAPVAGALFVTCGGYCAVRTGRAAGVAAFGIGLILLVPLVGLDPTALMAYKILVGAVLGVFGIVKIT